MDDVQHKLLTVIDEVVSALDANHYATPGGKVTARTVQDFCALRGEDWSLASIYSMLDSLSVLGYVETLAWPGGFVRTRKPCPRK